MAKLPKRNNPRQKTKLKIAFTHSLYGEDAVQEAISDYKHLADFSLKVGKGYSEVSISNIRDVELEPLFLQEFSNYVLSLKGCSHG